MSKSSNSFEINHKDKALKIDVVSIGGQILYRVFFTDMPNLVITRAKNANATKFWTSIPEGKQQLAEEIGKLIEEHNKSKS